MDGDGKAATVKIERLALHLTGLTESESHRLALLVTEGLAAAGLPDRAVYRIGTVRIQAGAEPGTGVERLSQQIVADLVAQLRRSA